MTPAQLQVLATALRAETNPSVVTALALGDHTTLVDWCNASSTQDAWNPAASDRDLFEGMNIAKFDNLTAGKRDVYKLMIDKAPLDMARNKMRRGIEDVWGADAGAVLQACVRKATNGEKYQGGTESTSSAVTAWKLNWSGSTGLNDVSDALNNY